MKVVRLTICAMLIALAPLAANARYHYRFHYNQGPRTRYSTREPRGMRIRLSCEETGGEVYWTGDRRRCRHERYVSASLERQSLSPRDKQGRFTRWRLRCPSVFHETQGPAPLPVSAPDAPADPGQALSQASYTPRDARGRLRRDPTAKDAFICANPCPSTHSSEGSCPGYVVDHIVALKRGGADDPSNMQWQTIEDAKAKDRIE